MEVVFTLAIAMATKSGSLLKLTTTRPAPINGLVQIDSNSVSNGQIVSISANNLTKGVALNIHNDGSSLSTGSLIKLSSKSTNVTNGILRMDTNDVRSGKLVSIDS